MDPEEQTQEITSKFEMRRTSTRRQKDLVMVCGRERWRSNRSEGQSRRS